MKKFKILALGVITASFFSFISSSAETTDIDLEKCKEYLEKLEAEKKAKKKKVEKKEKKVEELEDDIKIYDPISGERHPLEPEKKKKEKNKKFVEKDKSKKEDKTQKISKKETKKAKKLSPKEEAKRKRLLAQVLGLYKDRIYSLAYKKAKEYLEKYPEDTENLEELIKIMLTSAIKTRNDQYILNMIDFVNKFPDLPEEFKEKVYGTVIKYYAKDKGKLKIALAKTLKYVKNPKLKDKFAEALVDLYFKDKQYSKIIWMPYVPPQVAHLKVIALYKLERYNKVIQETEDLDKFNPEVRDKMLYYRALSFYKLGDMDKAVKLFEKMKEKNPEILKIIVSYYLKKDNYDKVRKYLYMLSKYPEYYDLAYYLLGYLEDREGNFDKAFQYYSVAAKYPSKYGRFAQKRIRQFLASDLLDVYYSIRLGLFSNKKYAQEFLNRLKSENCFMKDYKDFFASPSTVENSKALDLHRLN